MTIDTANADLLHLRDKTRSLALLSDDQRIAVIQEGFWISLSTAKNVIDKLQTMLDAPRVTKPPCLLLVGNSDSGKSSIFERFLYLHPPDGDSKSPVSLSPVVSINCPDGRERGAIYVRILTAPLKSRAFPLA